MYEVEQKFRVADPAGLRKHLETLGAKFDSPLYQRDLYLAHPCRSFRETDEAFRIRRDGEGLAITYKGPKIDKVTKTRLEIDIPLVLKRPDGADSYLLAREMFGHLGFEPVKEVVKQRIPGIVEWEGERLLLALDQVEGLGDFVEIEILSSDEELTAKRTLLLTFAKSLNLGEPELRGYLDLLLQ
jgi:adenylate cyclase class 2